MRRAKQKTLKVCGLDVPVRTGTSEDHASLADAYGCYDLNTGVIWMDASCPAHELGFWTTHEALHALLNRSGAVYTSAAALGLDLTDDAMRGRIDAWEEALVRLLTPHIIETFGAAKAK